MCTLSLSRLLFQDPWRHLVFAKDIVIKAHLNDQYNFSTWDYHILSVWHIIYASFMQCYAIWRYAVMCECMPSYFTQPCAIWCYAAPSEFPAKLYHLMVHVHCVTWQNTMPFHPRPIHFASHWSCSAQLVLFHVRCSAIPSYPVSIAIMLSHFVHHYRKWSNKRQGVYLISRVQGRLKDKRRLF